MGHKLCGGGSALCSRGSWVFIEHKVAWAQSYLHTKCHIDPFSRLATMKMGRKLGALSPFWGRGAVSPSITMWLGPRPTSMSNAILIHPAVRRQYKWAENWGGALPPFWGGELVHHLAQCDLDQVPPPYQVASSCIQPFGHSRNLPKIGRGLRPLLWRGLGPHLTQSPLG